MLPKIETPTVQARMDKEAKISYVKYSGEMTPQMTIDVYRWIIKLADSLTIEDVIGSIYDFREVTNFERYSLSTVQRESKNLNMNFDFSTVPVALLVESKLQETMVRVGMRVTPQENRKRIVFSEEEALEFIHSWQNKNESQSGV